MSAQHLGRWLANSLNNVNAAARIALTAMQVWASVQSVVVCRQPACVLDFVIMLTELICPLPTKNSAWKQTLVHWAEMAKQTAQTNTQTARILGPFAKHLLSDQQQQVQERSGPV